MLLHPRLCSQQCFDYFHTHRIPSLDNPNVTRTVKRRHTNRARTERTQTDRTPTARRRLNVVETPISNSRRTHQRRSPRLTTVLTQRRMTPQRVPSV